MRPDHLFGPDIRMLWNSGSPIIGRFASAGLGFLSSTIGWPVAGLTGSRNHTTTPQIASPHLLTRTLASPAWVSQMPIGLPAVCAMASGAQSSAAKTEIGKPNPAIMENLLGKVVCITKKRIRAMSCGSLAPARQANGCRGRETEHYHRSADQREQRPGRSARGRQPPA